MDMVLFMVGELVSLVLYTCRFNKRACPHVLKVVNVIDNDQVDVPEYLQQLSLCMENTKSRAHKPPLASLQSTKPVPFKFPSQ